MDTRIFINNRAIGMKDFGTTFPEGVAVSMVATVSGRPRRIAYDGKDPVGRAYQLLDTAEKVDIYTRKEVRYSCQRKNPSGRK